jgi:CheY-like chemotaxis protein
MMTILVADDAPSVRMLLRMILQPSHQVIEAGDGEQALCALVDHCPEVAILDVSMPGVTGIEVCRQLRLNPRTAATGVIVVTANGTAADRDAALAAGADYFLSKPFSPAVMLELVEILLRDRLVSAR